MKFKKYIAPAIEPVLLMEAELLADSLSNGDPIVGPSGITGEDMYYEPFEY